MKSKRLKILYQIRDIIEQEGINIAITFYSNKNYERYNFTLSNDNNEILYDAFDNNKNYFTEEVCLLNAINKAIDLLK